MINKKNSILTRFLRDFGFICTIAGCSLWISAVLISNANAQTALITVKLADAELTIALSEKLAQLPPPLPGVRLFAKNRGPTPYPTLNLIEQPGALTQDRSKLESETLTSYRSVGLTDAKIISSSQTTCNNRVCELLEIDYSMNGVALRAALLLIDCGSSTALFTLTGMQEQGEQLELIRADLIESLRLVVHSNPIVIQSGETDWLFFAGCGLILLLLLIILRLRNSPKKLEGRAPPRPQ